MLLEERGVNEISNFIANTKEIKNYSTENLGRNRWVKDKEVTEQRENGTGDRFER